MGEIWDLVYTEREMAGRRRKDLRIGPKEQNCTTESVGPLQQNQWHRFI